MQIKIATCFVNVSLKCAQKCKKSAPKLPLGMQYEHCGRGRVKR